MNRAQEWMEIRKHILLYMLTLKDEGLSENEINTKTTSMLERTIQAVKSGSALDKMYETEIQLKTIEDSMRRAQRHEM